MDDETIPDYCTAEVLVLGCGNPLVGDDGFGPAVAERLLGMRLPKGLCVMNVETSSRGILFNLATGPSKPAGIIIIDAMNSGRRPGSVYEAGLDELSVEKADDFTLHLTPISNMLVDLKKMGVTVRILACQPSPLPDMIKPGLSKSVEGSLDAAVKRVLRMAAEMAIEGAESLLGLQPKKQQHMPRNRTLKLAPVKKPLKLMRGNRRPKLAIHANALKPRGDGKGKPKSKC